MALRSDALDVLDDGQFERLAVAHLAHHDRHVVQLGQLGGAPAALARHDLVSVGFAGDRPHQDRLQNALLLHRLGEVVQILFARNVCAAGSGWASETRSAWCARAAARFAARRHRLFADQSGQAAAQVRADAFLLPKFSRLRAHAAARIRSRWISSPASLM